VIELPLTQRAEHRLVLRLHHHAHDLGHLLRAHVIGVRRLRRLQDAAAIGEQVRDDVRVLDARVFRLNVKDASLVANVVVEAEQRGR
jgi:hypothetical protein